MTITLTGRRLGLALLACACVGAASFSVPKQEAPPDPGDPGGVLLSSELLADRGERLVDERASRARRTPIMARPPQRSPRASAAVVAPPKASTPAPRRATPAPSTSRVERVVQYALAQVGDPYVWGADGPSSWDCSGLVMMAYAQVGIRLPHQSGAMLSYGQRVSRSELRRGDLVWPAYGHVALYLGGGRIVHASNPRTDVLVSPLYSFWTARRLL